MLLYCVNALLALQYKKRKGAALSELDLTSCMKNQLPGSTNLTALSFDGAFHGDFENTARGVVVTASDHCTGRTLGILSATRSKPIHKVDFPAFDWPMAQFPRYKYPLDKNAAYNKEQDQKSLQSVCFPLRAALHAR